MSEEATTPVTIEAAVKTDATAVAHDAERDSRSELHKLFDAIVAEAEKVGHWSEEELKALKAKL